ncbi:MAG: acyl-CoA dehydrogenase C-terminal domain-containing protein [Myxococcales bacterium]|nr:acyl-CoA dehydrogenase C-terminal domain-containing protein [Myxococcales bacterium]
MADENPLVSDREVELLLHEVHDAVGLTALPAFGEHTRETFDLYVESARRLARQALWPAFVPMDEQPPQLRDGRVHVHPVMRDLWPRMVELGLLTASRPEAVGGLRLPLMVSTLAEVYLMAANASAFGYVGLTKGAAHLLEAFADQALRERFMVPLYEGRWTGTMALTEPQAGSSLADVRTVARPMDDGSYRLRGAKIFISGADHDFADNVVNMTLARIEGAPAGLKGISLFVVPRLRPEGDRLVDNDVSTAGLIHKIGWRGLPSLVLSLGERDDCRGWRVGPPGGGLACMFQMMNEARIMIGLNGVASASVAYHEALAYARGRPQGRPLGAKDPAGPQVPIIEHADVRRMLLRQKAIVEGGLSLLVRTAKLADLADHGAPALRGRARAQLDLLTPIAKSFPAEQGFEANVLALQIHGGYGYSSEYRPQAWLRDQKLNSIHEGTTGIQALDLLGRKILGDGGATLRGLLEELEVRAGIAAERGVAPAWIEGLRQAVRATGDLAADLLGRGREGWTAVLGHATDVLDLMGTLVVAGEWVEIAGVAHAGLRRRPADEAFYRGKLHAAQYWLAHEVPRVPLLARRVATADDAFTAMPLDGF